MQHAIYSDKCIRNDLVFYYEVFYTAVCINLIILRNSLDM